MRAEALDEHRLTVRGKVGTVAHRVARVVARHREHRGRVRGIGEIGLEDANVGCHVRVCVLREVPRLGTDGHAEAALSPRPGQLNRVPRRIVDHDRPVAIWRHFPCGSP